MQVNQMVTNYNDEKRNLSSKVNGIGNAGEAAIYDYINELDEINEEVKLYQSTAYPVDSTMEEMLVIETDGNISVPQMIENNTELQTLCKDIQTYIKGATSSTYNNFLNSLETIQTKVGQAIDYQAKQVAFNAYDITSSGRIRLDAPTVLGIDSNKVLTWDLVPYANSYVVAYKEENATDYTQITAVQSLTQTTGSVSLNEIAASGNYLVKVTAITNDTANYISSNGGFYNGTYVVTTPAIKLQFTDFDIDTGSQMVIFDEVPNATGYIVKVLDYPASGSNTPLTTVVNSGVVTASLSGITQVGVWTVEAKAIGDGTLYLTSDPMVAQFEVFAPAVKLVLNSSSVSRSGDKTNFTFDSITETPVTYVETSGIASDLYTITDDGTSVTVAITNDVNEGGYITPSIKAVPTDTVAYIESDAILGADIGKVKTLDDILSASQVDAVLDLFVTSNFDESTVIELKFNSVNIVDQVLEYDNTLYSYSSLDGYVTFTNLQETLVNLGALDGEVVTINAINKAEVASEWVVNSNEFNTTFTVTLL